ncbi:hypothetical protein M2140_001801 [Clostridiales Family XIII bacterium PM5-7]
MFLTERDLKETFWQNYNYSGRAIKYQFECPIRDGGADLVTIEKYQGNYQINSFEFKLSDIKKVILQAKGNLPFSNKSWIVVPDEKEKLILEKYEPVLKASEYIGVITVEEGGRWKMIYQPKFQNEIKINQALLSLMMGF